MNKHQIDGLYTLFTPDRIGPVVVDSPHSGRTYPDDFGFTCDYFHLRRAEDLLVDELLTPLPATGCAVLQADFPRTYIDPNRAISDIDPALFRTPWPGLVSPQGRSSSGIGLIRRILRAPDQPIYTRLLEVDEGTARIENYYRPYHDALADMLAKTHALHGYVLHLNIHSMPGDVLVAEKIIPVEGRPDIILGDRKGTSCSGRVTSMVAELFKERGYRVAVNTPYAGAEIVRRHGRPSAGINSLQIEIDRKLYVNEETFAITKDAEKLRRDLSTIIQTLSKNMASGRRSLAAE